MEKKLDTQFTPNVYFWTPNSEILAKALCRVASSAVLVSFENLTNAIFMLVISIFSIHVFMTLATMYNT